MLNSFKIKYLKSFLLIVVFFLCFSCHKTNKLEKEIGLISIDIEIVRFDKVFGNSDIDDLQDLKSRFPVFFPKQYPDSIWKMKMNDSLTRQLFKEVIKKYPDELKLTDDLRTLFKHIRYYYPSFKVPKVITANSDVDYKNKVFLSDQTLIVSLDNYLGSDHFFYQGIPEYISRNMKESLIISDVASVCSQLFIPKINKKTFLSQMIYYGRILYLKDIWLTKISDDIKIGYSEDELKWVQDNENQIWRNFIENEYLFSTNPKLISRFISLAPFSKFYLEIDNDSPGMVGRYIGWQIVRSFMDKKDASLEKLMTLSDEEIFYKSKYKPIK